MSDTGKSAEEMKTIISDFSALKEPVVYPTGLARAAAYVACVTWRLGHDWECTGWAWFKCRRCGKEEGI